jgi:hypothetical protein
VGNVKDDMKLHAVAPDGSGKRDGVDDSLHYRVYWQIYDPFA